MCSLILTERFLPSVGGSINWLINSYSRYDFDRVVFVTPDQKDSDKIDRLLPFCIERIPAQIDNWDPLSPKSFYQYLKVVYFISSICLKYNVHQIHCAKVLPEGLIAHTIYLLLKIPYLLYAHGEEIQFGITSKKFRWIMPIIYSRSSVIISNSMNTQLLLSDLGIKPQKIHVIHPGVDINHFYNRDNFKFTIRQQFNIGMNPTLLTVGRLQRRKGHDMVIRALPIIQQRFPLLKYLIVGDGEELSYLRDLSVSSGVTHSVIFAGRVSDEDLPKYYAASDIFIMANRAIDGDIEGFGIVFLEAAAAGKPAIGGRSGGTAEAVIEGITGLRIDGNNPWEIAQAVISLLSDPVKMQTMGMNGRLRVETEFTWESVVRRTQLLAATI
jgi:phosphatidylinositol alpha-1,6-mannosyltransferase